MACPLSLLRPIPFLTEVRREQDRGGITPMLVPYELKVFANYVARACARAEAGTELTQVLIARSLEQLERSREILKTAPPKVWHPKPK